jgi:hypothetical protein
VVLDGIGWATHEKFGNKGPLVAVLGVSVYDDIVFILRPRCFANAWTQVIEPPRHTQQMVGTETIVTHASLMPRDLSPPKHKTGGNRTSLCIVFRPYNDPGWLFQLLSYSNP